MNAERLRAYYTRNARLPVPAMPLEWQLLAERELPVPDQSRYGTATTDPLGRDGPGWHKDERTMLPVRNSTRREAPSG